MPALGSQVLRAEIRLIAVLMLLSVFTGGEWSFPWRGPQGAANMISSLMVVPCMLGLLVPTSGTPVCR